ncbi:hypothetical protein GCM10010435_59210 [Winogradskya consettensis]|uniref:Uncharacterized protein n=1 Tax=Winogradskya consettensis TaxID=113560 RepID=A0A919SMF3_9ACTN|nr:hypothetical protein Aco04nite_39070 [Actinoplanes consettensis]
MQSAQGAAMDSLSSSVASKANTGRAAALEDGAGAERKVATEGVSVVPPEQPERTQARPATMMAKR